MMMLSSSSSNLISTSHVGLFSLSSSRNCTKVKPNLSISAILTNDNSTMLSEDAEEADTENIRILSTDLGLALFKDHFKYRVRKYVEQKKLLEKHERCLEEFAKGYLKFGFNREEGNIVYNEWAPTAQGAQIIGDFNGWDGANHKMEKNQFGVWSTKISDSGGSPATPYNSRVKFRFKHGDRAWVDRILAWIKYATMDPTRFAAPCEGIYKNPPPLERYR